MVPVKARDIPKYIFLWKTPEIYLSTCQGPQRASGNIWLKLEWLSKEGCISNNFNAFYGVDISPLSLTGHVLSKIQKDKATLITLAWANTVMATSANERSFTKSKQWKSYLYGKRNLATPGIHSFKEKLFTKGMSEVCHFWLKCKTTRNTHYISDCIRTPKDF